MYLKLNHWWEGFLKFHRDWEPKFAFLELVWILWLLRWRHSKLWLQISNERLTILSEIRNLFWNYRLLVVNSHFRNFHSLSVRLSDSQSLTSCDTREGRKTFITRLLRLEILSKRRKKMVTDFDQQWTTDFQHFYLPLEDF